MDHLLGQQLIIGLSGEELTLEESQFIIENNIGGVVLFSRNLKSVEQIYKLINDIRELRHKMKNPLPLFISVDMEGGRVMRLKAPFTKWPALRNLGDTGSPPVAFEFAGKMGRELGAIGFNLNYAPCVDVLTNPDNEVIGDRALGSQARVVAKLAPALVRGYRNSEVLSCAKHFPGHGATSVDSHFDLPVDRRSLEDLKEQGDLWPFKEVIQSGVDMIMTAHIHYPDIDPEFPVTLSPLFIKKLLRQGLHFKGLVVTDDLDMKAVSENFNEEKIPVLALQAGANILLYCKGLQSPMKAIESLRQALEKGLIPAEVIRENLKRIESFKMKKLKHSKKPVSLDLAKKIIGCREHLEFVRAVTSRTVGKPIP